MTIKAIILHPSTKSPLVQTRKQFYVTDGRKGLYTRDFKESKNELFHLQGGFDLAAHAVVYEEKIRHEGLVRN